MAGRSTSGRVVIGGVAAVVLLFVVAGIATQGVGGGLLMLGLVAVLVGLGASIAGRARWAFISSRKIGGIVAAAGLAALLVGTATATPTTPTAATSAAPATDSVSPAEAAAAEAAAIELAD